MALFQPLEELAWRELLIRALCKFRRQRLGTFSAQFAYYSMLVIAPALILIIAATARLPLKGVLDSFLDSTNRALPRSAYDVIVQQIDGVQKHSTPHLVLLALVLFSYAGSQLFLTIVRGLNVAYEVEDDRTPFRIYGMALLLTLGSFLTLIIAEALLVVGPQLSDWFSNPVYFPVLTFFLTGGVRWTIVCVAIVLSTSFIYWLAPNAKTPWCLLTPGNVVAVFGWVFISLGFRYYVNNYALYNETYGAIGGVIILMIWLYLTGMTLFVGGQINGIVYHHNLKKAREM